MPARVDAKDWNRHFRKGARRRGGPLQALANVLIIGIVLVLLVGGAVFAVQYSAAQNRAAQATQQAQATTTAGVIFATRTARVEAPLATETALAEVAAATATAISAQPTIGTGSVIAAGNLRSEPRIAPETVMGQICIGDEVMFLEEQLVSEDLWYRIQITGIAVDCTPERVAIDTIGWASSTLLSAPSP